MKLKVITIAAALGVLVAASSCTKNIPEYNNALYGATDEDLQRSAQGGNELKNLITWVIPNQENGFQMTPNIVGGPLSGFASATGFIDDIAAYAPRSGWNAYPYTDTYPNHLYNNYRLLFEKAKGDLNEPYFALGQILRVAITSSISDIYGPVPYSKITGTNLTAPYDTQEELYTNMLKDLQDATAALDKLPDTYQKYQFYDEVYKGNMHKWADYGRSLMLRLAIRISGVAPAMAKQYGEWAVANGVISSNDANATLPSGDNPLYKIEIAWLDSRAGADVVEYLKAYSDPRLSAMIKPGVNGDYVGLRSSQKSMKEQAEVLAKHASTNITSTSPITWISAAEVSFLKAEGKLLGWNMGGESAKALYENGIRLSFEQWGVSGVADYLLVTAKRGGYTDPYVPENDLPSFSSDVTVNWESAAGDVAAQKAMIATQKWIALFPYNTIEAWAEWRRTGYPNLLPAIKNLSQGTVADIHQVDGRDEGGMRRLMFPQTEYDSNKAGVELGVQDIGGKDSYAANLWWDD